MESNMIHEILALTNVGSEWVLWILLALSVLSIGVMIERIVFFNRSKITDFNAFCLALSSLLDAEKVEEAIEFCNRAKTFEGMVALSALKNYKMGPDSIAHMTASSIARERQTLDRGLMILGTLGNNSPFIGLFGTVLGIIQAFHALSLNPSGGSAVVMAGISDALVATAVGLVVAIPAVIAFNAFQRIVKKRLANAESIQQLMLSHLVRTDK